MVRGGIQLAVSPGPTTTPPACVFGELQPVPSISRSNWPPFMGFWAQVFN